MAHALVEAGHSTAAAWTESLGHALDEARAAGAPDTEDTYFTAALAAVERLSRIAPDDLRDRKTAWEAAYRRTPHGHPVALASTDSIGRSTGDP